MNLLQQLMNFLFGRTNMESNSKAWIYPVKRKINRLVIHCSATTPNMDIGAEVIRVWHVRDNKWSDIGYHLVIKRDGTIEKGRPLEQAGAHVAGHNHDSIGICLIGGIAPNGRADNNFTEMQFKTLENILKDAKRVYPAIKFMGHRDLDPKKECPSFDVNSWIKTRKLI